MSPEPGLSTQPETTGAPSPASEEPKRSHLTIARHLTKLREAASAILALLAPSQPSPAEAVESPTSAATAQRAPTARPKSPLQIRIDRHSSTIDRALKVVAELNPEGKARNDLPDDLRDTIARQERIARGVIDAEIHFWSATIENNPIIRLDELESHWVRRLLDQATVLGCSPDYQEHLAFLRTWNKNAHH
jgi:hypothetical protein